MSAASIPSSFLCPISLSLMSDPVIDPTDGRSYDRSSLVTWVQQHGTSPATRAELRVDQIIPNRSLKESIDEFLQQQAQGGQSSDSVQNQVAQLDISPAPASSSANSSSISVKGHTLNVSAVNSSSQLLLSLGCDSSSRTPSDVICVVDVSGSMGSSVEVVTSRGVERDGLSRLDLVKHALRTIVAALGPNDRFALISFETGVSVVYQLQPVDKDRVEQCIEALQPEGSTNLWGGIAAGLNELIRVQSPEPHVAKLLDAAAHAQRNSALFILTDGEPNVDPPLGYNRSLQQLFDANPLVCSLHTFGFGYDVQSDLLEEIAAFGGGQFCFIPDAGILGTVFVNALSSLLCNSHHVQLLLPKEVDAFHASKHYRVQKRNEQSWLQLGPIQQQQTRDISLRLLAALPPATQLHISAVDFLSGKGAEITVESSVVDEQTINNHVAVVKRAMIQSVNDAMIAADGGRLQQAQENMAAIPRNPVLGEILRDLDGQISIAFSKQEYWRKWGRHYLRSLLRAHIFQFCTNFKDAGLQNYGGALFHSTQNVMNDIFLSLPPPKPSNNYAAYGSSASAAPGGPVSMSSYYNSSNPCFHADSLVLMHDGSTRRVGDMKSGDLVKTSVGAARVDMILRTRINGNQAWLCTLDNGLKVTPFHPILHNNEWVFPHEIVEPQLHDNVDYVYSFVLNQHHIITINSTPCICLGHNYTQSILSHPYFGSKLIIDDMMHLNRVQNNHNVITINNTDVERDVHTNLICGIGAHSSAIQSKLSKHVQSSSIDSQTVLENSSQLVMGL